MLTSAVVLASRTIIGVTFGSAALMKSRQLTQLVETIAAIVPHRRLSQMLAVIVLLMEGSVAALALLDGGLQLSGALSLILCASFGAVSVMAMARGLNLACACFGRRPGQLGARTLARSLLISAPALTLLFYPEATRLGLQTAWLAAVIAIASVGLALLILRATELFFGSSTQTTWKEVVG